MTERICSYKNNAKVEQSKAKRIDGSKRLRKAKREDDFIKRRKLDSNQSVLNIQSSKFDSKEIIADIQSIVRKKKLEEERETEVLTHCFTALRNRIIDSDNNFDLLSLSELLYLIDASFSYRDPLLDYEILWALTNLTARLTPFQIEELFLSSRPIECFSPDLLLNRLLKILTSASCSGSSGIPRSCLACWAIGNMIIDSDRMRSVLLSKNILEHLIELESLDIHGMDKEFLMTQAWLIGNILKNNNPPVHHSVAVKALPRLVNLLKTNIPSVLVDVMR